MTPSADRSADTRAPADTRRSRTTWGTRARCCRQRFRSAALTAKAGYPSRGVKSVPRRASMFRLDADRGVQFCDGLRRRDFLHAGALATLGLSLTDWFQLHAEGPPDVNCILLMLIGGPSQLDTFDMKPNAPTEIRGPYKPIKTNIAGIEISENFPRIDRKSVV